MSGLRAAKGPSPAWFRVDSVMNRIKQMEIVTRRRCVWFFSSMVWVLSRYARAPWFESPFGPYTCDIKWLSVGPSSGSEQQNDCPQPLLMWTHTFAKYSSWDAVNLRKCINSIRGYNPQMRDITWIMLRPVTQQTPGLYLCCKSICTNIIFPDGKTMRLSAQF